MTEINCAEACKNGCVLGDRCPNREYAQTATKFIAETSLDDMLRIAQSRFERPFQSNLTPMDGAEPDSQ